MADRFGDFRRSASLIGRLTRARGSGQARPLQSAKSASGERHPFPVEACHWRPGSASTCNQEARYLGVVRSRADNPGGGRGAPLTSRPCEMVCPSPTRTGPPGCERLGVEVDMGRSVPLSSSASTCMIHGAAQRDPPNIRREGLNVADRRKAAIPARRGVAVGGGMKTKLVAGGASLCRALSRCGAERANGRRLRNRQAAATAVRHVVMAAARSARCVWAEVR